MPTVEVLELLDDEETGELVDAAVDDEVLLLDTVELVEVGEVVDPDIEPDIEPEVLAVDEMSVEVLDTKVLEGLVVVAVEVEESEVLLLETAELIEVLVELDKGAELAEELDARVADFEQLI